MKEKQRGIKQKVSICFFIEYNIQIMVISLIKYDTFNYSVK